MKTPNKDEVFQARAGVGQTQAVSALVLGVSLRSWQDWEAGVRPMSPQLYALYMHMTGQVKIPFGSAR